MKRWITLFCMILLLQKGVTVQAESSWSTLNELADQALSLAQQEHYKEAITFMDRFNDELTPVNRESLHISTEQFRILQYSHSLALQALEQGNNEEEPSSKVMQFRLLVDALQTNHQPLWTEMEEEMLSTFGKVKENAETGDQVAFQEDLAVFLQQYDLILPSAQVDRNQQDIEKMNDHVAFLNNQSLEAMSDGEKEAYFKQIEKDLQTLFEKAPFQSDVSTFWVMMTIGSIIVTTLLYVGWRKYIGSQTIHSSY
ncbi:sporulation protein YpjB [Priestia endophytica]|jgi:sporulation protein YpjB|uniref:sporulation protein YpjB n=1 Tax=Priestia endophytica TaxID=135735 RepID=UPI000F532549|nr:sporulation protein YpjB [Priestia endophytica]MED4072537.1 sporulation protein YpjB [Priestia endophytica]RPK12847.1 hypothetical protein FH5_03053 [Priestia endophytica]